VKTKVNIPIMVLTPNPILAEGRPYWQSKNVSLEIEADSEAEALDTLGAALQTLVDQTEVPEELTVEGVRHEDSPDRTLIYVTKRDGRSLHGRFAVFGKGNVWRIASDHTQVSENEKILTTLDIENIAGSFQLQEGQSFKVFKRPP
jgi:hypothetical protein